MNLPITVTIIIDRSLNCPTTSWQINSNLRNINPLVNTSITIMGPSGEMAGSSKEITCYVV